MSRQRSSLRRVVGLSVFLGCCSCTTNPPAPNSDGKIVRFTADASNPEWASRAIWYQIFVERFRNGDPSNDPKFSDTRGSWPHLEIENWSVTPWGHDWYREDDWAKGTGKGFYTTVQARRYGGDLQGVIDRLDYLADLGVNAIYLNPINDSPSLHKYDARSWRHVDRNFGPDPAGDVAIVAQENPVDPDTWEWTAADKLFLKLLREAHSRDIRVIVDYSFNHTGITFWAWKDVLEKQRESQFADWYEVKRFDDPATPENEFEYEGWIGVPELPEMRKYNTSRDGEHGPLEGDLHPAVKRHTFAVVSRWLDPNGDGDPSDGVDGFRLDVAERVPLGYWRDFRRHVKSIRPDAYLVAELWWKKWPDELLDPSPWLEGDVFDAAMNYRWFRYARCFLNGAEPSTDAWRLKRELLKQSVSSPSATALAMMNCAATHDTPRLGTSITNSGKYKHRANPRADPEYVISRPSDKAWKQQQALLLLQFAWIGAPHIWYGDEVGMWGADDPDCRKPMVWHDIRHESESARPDGSTRDPEGVNTGRSMEIRMIYRAMIRLRREHCELLSTGSLEIRDEDNKDRDVFVFRRRLGRKEAVVVVSRSDEKKTVELHVEAGRTYFNPWNSDFFESADTDGVLRVPTSGIEGRVLIAE